MALDAPHFRTVSDFRKLHLKALGSLFKQILQLCEKAGQVKLGHVALDGTKIKANASKHKAMSYERAASHPRFCVVTFTSAGVPERIASNARRSAGIN